MVSGTFRLAPFLAASVAMHVIAIGALGTESLSIAMSPDGTGNTISVRLEATATARGESGGDRSSSSTIGDSPTAQPAASKVPIEPDVAPSRTNTAPEPDTVAQRPESTGPATEPDVGPKDGTARTEGPQNGAATPHEARPRSEVGARKQARQAKRIAHVEHPDNGAATSNSRLRRSAARDAIVAELARYFHYPRLAIRQGWQGTVILSVRILPNGRLGDIRVKKSSGRALLDRSATDSLGQVKRLPGFADRIGDDGLALEIPVTYRLESA